MAALSRSGKTDFDDTFVSIFDNTKAELGFVMTYPALAGVKFELM
jgi:hypothetical protein